MRKIKTDIIIMYIIHIDAALGVTQLVPPTREHVLPVWSVQLQDFVTELRERQLGVPRFQQLCKLTKLIRIQFRLQLKNIHRKLR